VNDCEKNHVICQNGGFCIDLIDDFRCVCVNHFTGSACERIDESVCDHVPNHQWYWNDTHCARVCICSDQHVIQCMCEEKHLNDRQCTQLSTIDETIGSTLRLTFDSHVTNKTCDTLYTLHALTSKSRDFCCHVISDDVLTVSSRDLQVFQNHVTRTIFPQLRHVSINNAWNRNESKTDFHVIFVFFCVLFVLILCFLIIYFFYSKKRQNFLNSNTNEVVIHCIQNNLKSESRAIDCNNKLRQEIHFKK
jgi:hypothetical protein